MSALVKLVKQRPNPFPSIWAPSIYYSSAITLYLMCGSVTQRKTLIISVQNDWLEKYQIMKGTQLNGVKIQQMSFSIICSYSSVSIVPFFNKSTTVITASDEKMCRCREGMDRWWAPCFLLPEPRPKYIPNSNQLFTVILNIPLTRNPTHHLDDA